MIIIDSRQRVNWKLNQIFISPCSNTKYRPHFENARDYFFIIISRIVSISFGSWMIAGICIFLLIMFYWTPCISKLRAMLWITLLNICCIIYIRNSSAWLGWRMKDDEWKMVWRMKDVMCWMSINDGWRVVINSMLV